jgi:murein L,D-transpeptidase YcbB/YkuD
MSLARARRAVLMLPLALGLLATQPAHAGSVAAPALQAQLMSLASGQVQTFYAHNATSLWVDADGTLDPAAEELVRLVETADMDGLSPDSLHAQALNAAVTEARFSPTPAVLARAEVALSQAFAAYVAALRNESGDAMQYEAGTLKPQHAIDYYTLMEASKAPSLSQYVRTMPWMHPLYAPLRRALMTDNTLSPEDRELATMNLERIRQIPPQPRDRHIIIDSANATLTMYDGDKIVDSMKVIVGKPEKGKQTPAYAGYIRTAFANPYWNVPDDMVRSIIARNVLNQGMGYLKRQGYEVLPDWSEDAEVLDPYKVDWAAVQRGDLKVHVRQKPGPRNSMGTIKYEFPNPYGIYLHDTPEKDLMDKDNRQLSAGCIRLEDAMKLGEWLLQAPITVASDTPEQRLDLPRPVPVYVVYLTAHAEGDRVAVGRDPYARDGTALASIALKSE